jgi:hypothetical protein
VADPDPHVFQLLDPDPDPGVKIEQIFEEKKLFNICFQDFFDIFFLVKRKTCLLKLFAQKEDTQGNNQWR